MPAVDNVMVGINGGLYRNTGSYSTPTWVEITAVRDVTPNAPWDMGDASSRGSRAKLSAKTQMDLSVSAVVRANPADAGYSALYDSSIGTGLLDLLVLNGKLTVEGAKGFRAEWNVSPTTQDQAIGGVIYDTFEMKPGYSSNGAPKTAVVGASSAVTYTAI